MAKRGVRLRTALEIARDRAEITRLRLRYRMTNKQMSDKITAQYLIDLDENGRELKSGKFPPHIGEDMIKAEILESKREYQEAEYDTIQDKRLEIIRQFEDLAVFAQERYDVSCVDKITITKENRDKDGETTTVEKETTVNTDGNKGYLDTKAFCLKFIAELYAVIPPKKIAPTNPEGTEAFKFEGGEEMKRLQALAQEAGLLLPPPAKDGI